MRIDQCICTRRLFSDLLDEANRGGLSLRQLAETTGASACCTMCGPYLRRAYRTGQATFTELLSHDDEPDATPRDALPHRRDTGQPATPPLR